MRNRTYATVLEINGEPHKICRQCNKPLPLTPEFWIRMRGVLTSPCKKCKRDKKRDRYTNEPLFRRKQLIDRSRDHRKARLACLTEYSGGRLRCVCCDESHYEFLTIDHIDGGGAEHRREVTGTRSASIYHWLVRNKFPSGFRVLCFNCNCARSTCGYCPHERERKLKREAA